MAELLPKKTQDAARADALAYRVERRDPATGEVRELLATGRSPGVAYAAYYAALREYVDGHITLCRDGQVIAASKASESGGRP